MNKEKMDALAVDYQKLRLELGQARFEQSLIEDQLEKKEYEINKLLNKMHNINEQYAKLNAEQGTEVALPKEESNVEAKSDSAAQG